MVEHSDRGRAIMNSTVTAARDAKPPSTTAVGRPRAEEAQGCANEAKMITAGEADDGLLRGGIKEWRD